MGTIKKGYKLRNLVLVLRLTEGLREIMKVAKEFRESIQFTISHTKGLDF
ncbi:MULTISPECIES: hypothetical protein [Pyrococcus]|nr:MULTISPECIES: hypothetical protein [Pyrococcus]MDK2870167.1 hypothetical protein [Pyrococcus sp.]